MLNKTRILALCVTAALFSVIAAQGQHFDTAGPAGSAERRIADAGDSTVYVDDDNCPGGKGSEEDPFCTIQAGIDAATDGDDVLVADGTYNELINFNGKAITVHSINGEAVTTIDGGGAGPVVIISGDTPETVLDGFTITGGFSCCGGGMSIGGSALVSNCTISGNSAQFAGGGISIGGTPMMTHCTISGNTIGNQGHGGGMWGGGSPTLTHCTFIGNSAGNGRRGGGMYHEGGSPTLTHCTFIENVSGNSGGGMYNINSSPTLTHCTFSGNSSNEGGGMANISSSTTVTNCTFSGNSAGSSGGGMHNDGDGGSPTLTNCTFSGNTARNGGGMYNLFSDATVTNCILWGDSPDEIFSAGASATVSFSDVQGGLPAGTIDGGGNIDADPLFADADGDNLRLLPGSPCIDAADNTAPGLVGITEDLDGNPRFIDDPDTEDCQQAPGTCGDAPVVDMGSYEFNFCPADFDDGNACTDDLCDPEIGEVTHVDNFDPATECCDPATGDIELIDDGSACTDDACNSETGQVTHVDNFDPATECCNPETEDIEVIDDGNACTDDTCDPETGQVTHVDNFDPETGCCDPATGLIEPIDDGNACTDDTCDPESGQVTHVDNFDPATECCDPATGLIELIDDGSVCTFDTCNPDSGEVFHIETVVCADGEVCDPETGRCISECGDCPTDVNGDGSTGSADLPILLGAWGEIPDGAPLAVVCLDGNGDGFIGSADLPILLGAWGPCP